MLYLDTTFIAPLVLNEDVSAKVESYLARQAAGSLAVSHWTRIEFGSLVAQEVRKGRFTIQTADRIIAEFETVVQESCQVWLPSRADYDLSLTLLANVDSRLRAGGALHLAIAKNQGADEILTLDAGLLKAAKLLKIRAARGIS